MAEGAIAVLTSGGDAPGMNAAVRAVTRCALARQVPVYAVHEGYQGLVHGGDLIRPLRWEAVGGILQRGGTVIGTARCRAFCEREGRRRAAVHLLERGIDRLVVIGGDGSLTGAQLLCETWPELLAEAVARGELDPAQAGRQERLTVAGLVGSIDNDLVGTDMTIGADTALHRIVDAIDALTSTAASHQRTFVVEVMGRRCGYLALMSALATGADWVLLPEVPPPEDWEAQMCRVLRTARRAGRRESIVVVAEGALDRQGRPIRSTYVREMLEENLQQEVRLTILGHVQRGGAPSAFDRTMSTLLGHAAVELLLSEEARGKAWLVGLREHRLVRVPLAPCVAATREVARALDALDFERVRELRGENFRRNYRTFRTLVRSLPRSLPPGRRPLRLAVLTPGPPAPGMNAAVRAAVRLGLDRGHVVLGVQDGFQGLIDDRMEALAWMDVTGWTYQGGSLLGTDRHVPARSDLYAIARTLEAREIDGLLLIGGWSAYEGAYRLFEQRENFPAFEIPLVLLPASINNDLPGSQLSLGSDTALNNIVEAVDKIKQSAVASRRVFVVEVMGRYCGYLALMGGLATGAERVYLHEEGITLKDLQEDVEALSAGFRAGKRLGLVIRNERANPVYTTPFIAALLEEEGGELFDVRQAVLGHLQQGGNPSPFDRILAARLACRGMEFLIEQAASGSGESAFLGLEGGQLRLHPLENFPRMVEAAFQRPKRQDWLTLRPLVRLLAQPGPPTAAP